MIYVAKCDGIQRQGSSCNQKPKIVTKLISRVWVILFSGDLSCDMTLKAEDRQS